MNIAALHLLPHFDHLTCLMFSGGVGVGIIDGYQAFQLQLNFRPKGISFTSYFLSSIDQVFLKTNDFILKLCYLQCKLFSRVVLLQYVSNRPIRKSHCPEMQTWLKPVGQNNMLQKYKLHKQSIKQTNKQIC